MALSLGTFEAFRAAIIYLIIYVLISINVFTIILCFRKVGSFSKIRHLIEFSTMIKSNYLLAIIFALVLLSLAGVPPLAGFLVSILFFLFLFLRILFYSRLLGFS